MEVKDQDVGMLANSPTTALNIELQLRMSAQRNDIIFRRILYQEDTWIPSFGTPSISQGHWFMEERMFRIDGDHNGAGLFIIFKNMLERSPAGSGFGIIFGRVQDEENTLGSVFLCFVPLISNLVIRGNVPSKVEINGITWFNERDFFERDLLEENSIHVPGP